MPIGDLYLSSVRPKKDLGVFFEYDGKAAWFYKMDLTAPSDSQIVGAIHIFSGPFLLRESDIEIRWSADHATPGLFICGRLWAAFSGASRFGGDYRPDHEPSVPDSVTGVFD